MPPVSTDRVSGFGAVAPAVHRPAGRRLLDRLLARPSVGALCGVLTVVLFFALQAPDVALSQITVGAIVVPVLVLLAMAKIREHDR